MVRGIYDATSAVPSNHCRFHAHINILKAQPKLARGTIQHWTVTECLLEEWTSPQYRARLPSQHPGLSVVHQAIPFAQIHSSSTYYGPQNDFLAHPLPISAHSFLLGVRTSLYYSIFLSATNPNVAPQSSTQLSSQPSQNSSAIQSPVTPSLMLEKSVIKSRSGILALFHRVSRCVEYS